MIIKSCVEVCKPKIIYYSSFLNQYPHFKSAISSCEYFAAPFVSLYCLLCSSPALLEITVSWWCLINKYITQLLKKGGWSFIFFLLYLISTFKKLLSAFTLSLTAEHWALKLLFEMIMCVGWISCHWTLKIKLQPTPAMQTSVCCCSHKPGCL